MRRLLLAGMQIVTVSLSSVQRRIQVYIRSSDWLTRIILSSDWSGEQFHGLEMLTDLLTPKGEQNIKQNIEVVSEDIEDEDDNEEEINFYFEQTLPEEESSEVSVDEDGYGFAFQKQNVYSKLLAGKHTNFLIG